MARGLGREGWVCVNHLLTGWPVAGFPGAVLPCSVSQRPDGLQLELWAEGGCVQKQSPKGRSPSTERPQLLPLLVSPARTTVPAGTTASGAEICTPAPGSKVCPETQEAQGEEESKC